MEACKLSVEKHIDAILMGAQVLGIGMGCMGAYQAVREIAYALEQINDLKHEDYVPNGQHLAKLIQLSKDEKAREDAAFLEAMATLPKQ